MSDITCNPLWTTSMFTNILRWQLHAVSQRWSVLCSMQLWSCTKFMFLRWLYLSTWLVWIDKVFKSFSFLFRRRRNQNRWEKNAMLVSIRQHRVSYFHWFTYRQLGFVKRRTSYLYHCHGFSCCLNFWPFGLHQLHSFHLLLLPPLSTYVSRSIRSVYEFSWLATNERRGTNRRWSHW